ncbi:ABC transporter permease [Chloroflexota bacterium]
MAETPIVTSAETREEPKRHPFLIELVIRLIKDKPLGVVGAFIVLVLLFAGIFADILAPFGYNNIHLADRLSGPSAQYILGTDNLGRDLLSRVIYGARISIIVGLSGSFLNSIIGIIIGGTSGYFGGKTDLIIQRFVDASYAVPTLFLVLTIMSIVGPGIWQVIFVIGLARGLHCRTERSLVIGIKENLYIQAARSIGAPPIKIFIRHIVPNVMPGLIIIFSMSLGSVILYESTLSFLGFGIPPPVPSWGGMLSGPGRQFMIVAPWMALWPGLALALVVYGANMLGDAMRDLLDPRLRGGLGRYGGVEKERAKRAAKAGVTS